MLSREEFLAELKKGLAGLPPEDAENCLEFYSEMIDDRMEEGLTEEEALLEMDPIDDIVSQTLADIPLKKLVRQRVRPKRELRAREIVLLVLGFPLWFPLLLAGFAVLLSLYIVIWALLISLWAVEIALWAAAAGAIIVGVYLIIRAQPLPGAAMMGAGLLCAGLSVFMFAACKEATKGLVRLTKRLTLGIKTLFISKERG